MKKVIPAIAFVCLAALAGCGNITKSKAPPISVYTLHAEKPQKRASSAAVIVQEPEMPAGFDTARIALHMSGGRRMDFYADAAWPDALNKVLQDFIIQSARFSAVTPDSGVNAPYALQVKVNDFQPVYADTAQGVAEVRVSLTFRLIDRSSEKLLRDFTLSEKTPASANTITAITGDLEILLRKVTAAGLSRIAKEVSVKKTAPEPEKPVAP
jgi:ABC-type uncharacterized transport system auxiliary subunit